MFTGMGETTRKQQHEAAIRQLARVIAKGATPGIELDLFKAYAFAAGVIKGDRGGWVYPFGRQMSAINGFRKLAEFMLNPPAGWGSEVEQLVERMGEARAAAHLADPPRSEPAPEPPKADPDSLEALVGKRVDINYGISAGRSGVVTGVDERPGMIAVDVDGRSVKVDKLNVSISAEPDSPLVESAKQLDAARAEARKLDGYYDEPSQLRPMDIVQLADGAIGVVERVNMGGDVLVRANDVRDGILSVFDVNALRSVPPIAYECAGVPGAVFGHNVPREFATSELSQRAVMRARKVAPDARLTLTAVKVDNRYEYGRAFVYAIASIIDATRLLAARCSNAYWHESAPARRLQPCAHCGEPVDEQVPVRTSAVEILTDGTRVPIGKPRETTISRGALDTLIESATGLVHGLSDLEALIKQQAAEPGPARATDPATDDDIDEIVERLVRRAQYLALCKVLDELDGWREGQRSNHDANAHRGEAAGEQCWEHWHSSDVRTMVADAASELRTADPNGAHVPSDLPAPL